MLFNSLTYLVFLALMVLAYCLVGAKGRRGIVLVGSLVFYAFWRVDFLALVVFSAAVDYHAAGRIAASSLAHVRKVWLLVSLGLNLGLLILFKYSAFIATSVNEALGVIGLGEPLWVPEFVLPLGISFYTFQTISYTIDVYRGVQAPVEGFAGFLSYVMFWPQLVAGPVLRAGEVIPQLQAARSPRIEEVAWGLRRLGFGLFKKVVLADSLAQIVDEGFALSLESVGFLDAWTLAFAFGMQIYFDFSGYSEMAIGSAAMMGIRFPENFNWPYMASSPRDFWKRWHISLSSWIRDYLYLPLTGVPFRSRSTGGIEAVQGARGASRARLTAALLLTWFIMGLWHGAAWQFAAWGIWHAVLILAYRLLSPLTAQYLGDRLRPIGWLMTLAGSMLGWLFFRAASLRDALALLGAALDPTGGPVLSMRENSYLVVAVVFLGMVLLGWAVRWWLESKRAATHQHLETVASSVALGAAIALAFLHLRQVETFIYFQF